MSACSNAMHTPPSAQRILVIRLGALGDVARSLPAVTRLRGAYPDARISWLVEPASAGLVALSPSVDDVLVFPRPTLTAALRSGRVGRLASEVRDVVRSVRTPGFDLVVDFHGILKSGVLSRISGAGTRVGYARPVAREGAGLAATHRAELVPGRRSRFERNAALVDYLGIEPAGVSSLGLDRLAADPADDAIGGGTHDIAPRREGARADIVTVPRAALERVDGWLGDDPPGVVLHPGTSRRAAHKRWRPERFAALARRMHALTGSPCIVTAGSDPAEAALVERIVRASAGAARRAPDTRGVADLAALLTRASLVVAADSGPLHLAAVLGTPVVQILGPTDPVENAPYDRTASRSPRVPMPCSPCRRGCADPACMDAVSVASVMADARALLAGGLDEATWPPWRAA